MNSTHRKPKGKGTIRLKHNPDLEDEANTHSVKKLHLTNRKEANKQDNKIRKGWNYTEKDIKKMNKWINK